MDSQKLLGLRLKLLDKNLTPDGDSKQKTLPRHRYLYMFYNHASMHINARSFMNKNVYMFKKLMYTNTSRLLRALSGGIRHARGEVVEASGK